jgi:hypothetical protein
MTPRMVKVDIPIAICSPTATLSEVSSSGRTSTPWCSSSAWEYRWPF